MTQQNITKPIQSIIECKINKIKKLGIKNFQYYQLKTVFIKNESDSVSFHEKFQEKLPISQHPYIFIFNEKSKELFFIFSFLDSTRKNFDIISKNYDLFNPFFYKIKNKIMI